VKKYNVLIVGANSDVGTHVHQWLDRYPEQFHVDEVSSFDNEWKKADFSKYDSVYHVAGIAHVHVKKSMEPLFYSVNRDLTIEVAKWAKEHGVKQFIFMSSMIVYQESKSLKKMVITSDTVPTPNGFYGDSKLQAEIGLKELECDSFKVVILRPPMIYGTGIKGNFIRLKKLAEKTPIFPAYHNQRSMLYIDNLSECVRLLILSEAQGVFYPQNRELADTVEIIISFATLSNHRVHVWKCLNPFVRIGAFFIGAFSKMFSTYYYDPQMSSMGFKYQIVSQKESFEEMSKSVSSQKNRDTREDHE